MSFHGFATAVAELFLVKDTEPAMPEDASASLGFTRAHSSHVCVQVLQ